MHSNLFPTLITHVTHALQVTGPFDAELLNALPRSLRFICHNGAGYDNIDIATCTQKGMYFAILLLLLSCRNSLKV